MKLIHRILLIAAAAALLGGGYWLGRRASGHAGHDHAATPASAASEADQVKWWTCSMHPEIHAPKPGKCPKCGMNLIPVMKGAGDTPLGPRELKLTPDAQKLAEVQTTPVVRRNVSVKVRMVGKIDFDETRLANIAAWVPGRLDRLYVDYTGVRVNKGDHLVYLYSPQLISAQEELLSALQIVRDVGKSQLSLIQQRARQTVESTREKLRLWGLTPEQIQQIEKSGEPSDHLTINAPVGGIVIHKKALEGSYVQEGAPIYTIADLSQVWVKLDAYESDLQWLHYGQEVEFETESYPGEVFKGRIAFIDPVLNPVTRTAKVRVNVPNKDGRLKPEMFVRAIVHSRVAAEGRVIDPALAGKWISPMHPEIVRDKPGPCPVCGMALVSAESLGYVSADQGTNAAPLVIPASAPLITGTRAVVYLAVPGKEGHFEGRQIVLGPRAGDEYIVRSGLMEGDLVVTRGNFKIDSAIQILAKPSMMNPTGGGPAPGHHHGGDMKGMKGMKHDAAGAGDKKMSMGPMPAPPKFRAQLTAAIRDYFKLQTALAADRTPAAADIAALENSVGAVDMSLLEGHAHMMWMDQLKALQSGLAALKQAGDLKAARQAFVVVSNGLVGAARSFDVEPGATVYVQHCPMAAGGKGADWLQSAEIIRNPYFGSGMLECGETKVKLEGRGAEGKAQGADATKETK